MPRTGGRWKVEWKEAVMEIVKRKRSATVMPPGWSCTCSPVTLAGTPAGMYMTMMAAGTSQLTMDGMMSRKNCVMWSFPRCHIMRVVMSPKGLKAPPALAATTTLMQPRATNCSKGGRRGRQGRKGRRQGHCLLVRGKLNGARVGVPVVLGAADRQPSGALLCCGCGCRG